MFQWNQTYIVNDAAKIELLKEGRVRVLGATDLVKESIVEVRKSPYVAPANGKVEITLKPITEELGRIKLYVRLSGSNNPYFANDMVFKGKPFIYEFKKTDTAESIAKTIKAINAAHGDNFLKVSGSGSTITFEGDNYMMLTEAVVEEFTVVPSHINGGIWKAVETTVNETKPENGFGTYEQILKDLRLPTTENTQWAGINTQEMPIPGAKYNQYTVTYKNEVGVQGAGHVGDLVTAQTTHAFYVLDGAVTTKFEEVFGAPTHSLNSPIKGKGDTNEWTPTVESPEVEE